MMEAKCPKCRYKFNVEVPNGITEISCVCPRCGTPFIFKQSKITEKCDNIDKREKSSTLDINKDNKETVTVSKYSQINKHFHTVLHHIMPTSDDVKLSKSLDRKYVLGGYIMLFFLAILIVFTFVHSCNSSENVSMMVDESQVVEKMDSSKSINGTMPKSNSKEKDGISTTENTVTATLLSSQNDHNESKLNLKRPKWLDGYWLKTLNDQLIILVIIRQKWITVVNKYEEHRGAFIYDHGHLKCNFDDGTTAIYTVDFQKKSIVSDNGVWIDKAK